MQLPRTDGMSLGIGKQNAVYQTIVAIPLVHQLMHSLGLGGSNDIDARLLYMNGDVQTASGDVQRFSAMCRQQLFYQLPLAVLVHGVEHTHDLIHKCHNAPLVHIVRLHQCLRGEIRNHSSLQYRYLRNLRLRIGKLSALSLFHKQGIGFIVFLVFFQQLIVMRPNGLEGKVQWRCLAYAWSTHKDDVQDGTARPASLDPYLAGVPNGGSHSRQHRYQQVILIVVLVFYQHLRHLLYLLRECPQRNGSSRIIITHSSVFVFHPHIGIYIPCPYGCILPHDYISSHSFIFSYVCIQSL